MLVRFLRPAFVARLRLFYRKSVLQRETIFLKNTIERAVILEDGDQLTLSSLPFELQNIETNPHDSLSAFNLSTVEKLHIQKILHHTKGNKTKAAELLGIGLTTLYRKMEEYQITI